MCIAVDLLKKIYLWIKKREDCAEKLMELARELESIREKCNASECVGNSVSVVGAACLLGAGAATLLSGGAAAPLLGLAGAAYTGVGVAVTLGTKITEHFVSSRPMKDAEEIEKESNEIAKEIQRLSEKLKDKIRRENPSASPDELDRLFMIRMVKAVAKWHSIPHNFNFHDFNPNIHLETTQRTLVGIQATLMVSVAGLLAFFAFKMNGKKYKILFVEGSKQIVKELSSTGFKTALKGSAMIVGGAVGMAFALPEAIDSWKELIKKNHVTEASQSLRDTAKKIREMTRTLREQLAKTKEMLEEMARREAEEKKWKFLHVLPTFASHKKQYRETSGCPSVMNARNVLIVIVVGLVYLSSAWRSNETQKADTEQRAAFRAGPLRFALLRVQSDTYQASTIPELISKHNLDVFLTTGVKIEQESAYQVLQDTSPGNFSFYFQAQKPGIDGVTVQFSEELLDDLLISDSVLTFQYVALELQHPRWKQPVLVITLHRVAAASWAVFLTELQTLLDQVSDCYDSMMLSGDFQQPDDDASDQFKGLLRANELVQHDEGGAVISRNVEISDLSVNVGADSQQYTTFNAKPQSKDTTAGEEPKC